MLKLRMNFWERVDYLRDCKGIPRKELAYKAKFSLNSISTGIARNSIPSADVAYRIAKVLGVSVEYLLTEKDSNTKKAESQLDKALKEDSALFVKYHDILQKLDMIDPKMRNTLFYMIEALFTDAVDKEIAKSLIKEGKEPPF